MPHLSWPHPGCFVVSYLWIYICYSLRDMFGKLLVFYIPAVRMPSPKGYVGFMHKAQAKQSYQERACSSNVHALLRKARDKAFLTTDCGKDARVKHGSAGSAEHTGRNRMLTLQAGRNCVNTHTLSLSNTESELPWAWHLLASPRQLYVSKLLSKG